ncbi:MAG: hypothetical protein ABIT16_11310 [Croceibacterium sp.]
MKAPPALLALLLLSACGQQEQAPLEAQRISLDDARHTPPVPLQSPETSDASWSVTGNGQAIDFGAPGDKPMITLACRLRDTPVQVRIIRHVTTRPGEQAIFPVLGNGTISRFKVDAALHEGEWRWEGAIPAADPMLDVFTGTHEIEATLPGGGTVMMGGSRIPGEFITWCRAGGQVKRAEAAEAAEAAEESAAKPVATSSAAPAR